MERDWYLSLRRRYQPERLRLVIVAESPPVSGRYFYNPDGSLSEPLFTAMIRYLNLSPSTKDTGLREFQRRGWLLVDATYEPVDAMTASSRDRVIARDYQSLCCDLKNLIPDRSVPLVLIKANVCRILEPKLAKEGFNVLNAGRVVYFLVPDGRRIFSDSSAKF
jgi:hypothetical protein